MFFLRAAIYGLICFILSFSFFDLKVSIADEGELKPQSPAVEQTTQTNEGQSEYSIRNLNQLLEEEISNGNLPPFLLSLMTRMLNYLRSDNFCLPEQPLAKASPNVQNALAETSGTTLKRAETEEGKMLTLFKKKCADCHDRGNENIPFESADQLRHYRDKNGKSISDYLSAKLMPPQTALQKLTPKERQEMIQFLRKFEPCIQN